MGDRAFPGRACYDRRSVRGSSVIPGLIVAGLLAGCQPATPLVEAITILDDTRDSQGPYLVDAVTLGVTSQHRVELSWAADDGPFIPLLMRGDGEERWQAAIPGQPAGTSVFYYLAIFDGDERLITAPDGAGAAPYGFAVLP